jgi:hypothetical protein
MSLRATLAQMRQRPEGALGDVVSSSRVVLPLNSTPYRAVSLPCEANPFDLSAIDGAFRQILVNLLNGERIECHVKHTVFEPISPPTAAIIDVSCVLHNITTLLF